MNKNIITYSVLLILCLLVMFFLPNSFLNYFSPSVPAIPPIYPLHPFLHEFPLEMEMTFYFKTDDIDSEKIMSVTHQVVYNAETKEYDYSYKLHYFGKDECLLTWDVLDKIYGHPVFIRLESNTTREFKHSSKGRPALKENFAAIYKPKIINEQETWDLVKLNCPPTPFSMD